MAAAARRSAVRRATLTMLAAALVLPAAAGCRGAQAPPIGYFLRGDLRQMQLGRVVFVELGGDDPQRDVASGTSGALYRAIHAKNLFHVDVVPADHKALRGLHVNRPGGLTLRDLSDLRTALGCDALMVGSMTEFRPYPRMHMGLYLRLLDLRRGRLLWGVDHVWEATEKATQKRIEGFYRRVMREGNDPVESDLASVSPRAFQKFIAWEVAESLEFPNRPTLKPTGAPDGGRQEAPPPRPRPSPGSLRKL